MKTKLLGDGNELGAASAASVTEASDVAPPEPAASVPASAGTLADGLSPQATAIGAHPKVLANGGVSATWATMNRKLLFATLCSFVVACGATPQVAIAPVAPVVAPAADSTAETEEAGAEPSAEELKKAEELEKLAADREAMRKDHQTEIARFTPELVAHAKALAEQSYPNAKTALRAVLAGKHRKPGNAERDRFRHPQETLELFGFSPTQTVLEVGPGEGWYTEILAPALARRGKLIVTNGDAKGPPEQRSTFYAERTQLLLDKSPELFGKVERVIVDGKAPKLGLKESVDLALVIRGMHGMHNNGALDAWLAELHTALEPKGVLGVIQHRARSGADPNVTGKQGYLPEKWLIERIESAGFALARKSELNANSKDTTDHPNGVWSLPPTLRGGDKDRDQFLAIGESDRMTLVFVKKAKPAAK